MDVYIFFIFLSLIFSLFSFFNKKKNEKYNQTHRLILVLLLLALAIEIIGEITSNIKYNNSVFYNLLFVYAETCLFFYFFYLISESSRLKKTIALITTVFIVFGIVNTLFFQPIHLEFHNYSYAIGSLFLIGLAIQFFMDVFNLKRYEEENLLSIPYFWIVTVILFFYSATFFFFTPLRLLYEVETSLILSVSIIIQFLAGLMYLVIGLAYCAPNIFKGKY